MADKLVPANDVVHVEIDPIGLPEKRRQEMSLDTFRAIEDELLKETMQVAYGIACFAQLGPDAEAPPEEWVRELGEKAAWTKFRVAKAAWMCQSEAPVGLKLAQATAIGIMRVRAADKAPTAQLNYSVVQVVGVPEFPEKEVER